MSCSNVLKPFSSSFLENARLITEFRILTTLSPPSKNKGDLLPIQEHFNPRHTPTLYFSKWPGELSIREHVSVPIWNFVCSSHSISFTECLPFIPSLPTTTMYSTLPPLLLLPRELLDITLSLLCSPSDLLSFALTSRTSASLAIPRHLHYRLLRVKGRNTALWAHLARRADLARNFRSVSFLLSEQVDEREIVPRDIDVRNIQPRTPLQHIEDVCRALGHMIHLEHFTFSVDRFNYTTEIEHRCILTAGLRFNKTELREMKLVGNVRAPNAWNPSTKHLTSVTLIGDIWIRPTSYPYLKALFKAHYNTISSLKVPLELGPLFHQAPAPVPPSPTLPTFSWMMMMHPASTGEPETLRFPHLKSLRLFLQSGGHPSKVHAPWVAFLEQLQLEGGLEELDWAPVGPVRRGSLRHLGVSRARGNEWLVQALADEEEEEEEEGWSSEEDEDEYEDEDERSESSSSSSSSSPINDNAPNMLSSFPLSPPPPSLSALRVSS